jgi:hypothetical protein
MKLHKKTSLTLFFIFFIFFIFVQNIYAMSKEEAIQARIDIVAYAKQFIGVPYVSGGYTSEGMDCSGFLFTVSREATGVQLPRTVSAMYSDMRIVPFAQLEAGDAIFFKTIGNQITHVGLYIGKNQFIHAISDGPNTGVIVSSLNQTTWHNQYAAVGQFLPATKEPSTETTPPTDQIDSKFVENLSFDGFASILWNCTTSDEFMFNLRGADLETHATYNGWKDTSIIPGFGIRYRFDPKMDIFQMPIIFSVTVYEKLRVYAGPVITFGDPVIIGNNKSIKASFFPGILGVSWQSPSWKCGLTRMSFVQDFAWTVFNDTDDSALDPYEALCTGLTFSTGFRVTIPASKLIK